MEDLVQFQTRCEELAEESVDTIFTDQVVYGVVSRQGRKAGNLSVAGEP